MPMSIRCVSLKALHRSHSPRSETPDSLWHGRLLKDEGGLLSRARLIRTDRGTRSAWPRFWEARRKPINTAITYQFAVGALSRLDTRPMHAHCNYWYQRRRTRSPIPTNGFFSIPRQRALPVVAARMPFSLALRGGKAAGLRSSSSSCASTARNARYCSPYESGSQNTPCLSRSTGSHLIGRCSKPAIARAARSLSRLHAHTSIFSTRRETFGG